MLFAGQVNLQAGIYKRWLGRLDSAGKQLWVRSPAVADMAAPAAMLAEKNGDFVVAGTKQIGEDMQVFLSRHDTLGNTLWQRLYSINKRLELSPGALSRTPDGGWLMAALSHLDKPTSLEKSWPAIIRTNAWGHINCNTAGGCALKSASQCDDGNSCTLDMCDPKKGCYSKPLGGMSCGNGKTCIGGVCI